MHPVTCNMEAVKETNIGSYMGIPLFLEDGTMFGTICAVDPNPYSFTESELENMKMVAELASAIIQKSQVRKELIDEERTEYKRLSIIGNLASGLADEMGNSLQSVQGLLQLTFEQFDGHGEYSKVVFQELTHMNKVLKDFIMATKPPAPSKKYLDINSLLFDSINEFSTDKLLKNISISTKIPTELPSVMADYTQIRQVILNLINNSMEAIVANGKIDIKVYQSHPNQIMITVSDNGKGIPVSLLDKIGLPFFTTKEDCIGLGLAISKRIVGAHDGTISIESGDIGTVVKVVLPIC
ncbi:GAF domain-containing protein [Cytobacillus suaedae]|nr:GAF domain-containing protein [Cytobacillus suaedae]